MDSRVIIIPHTSSIDQKDKNNTQTHKTSCSTYFLKSKKKKIIAFYLFFLFIINLIQLILTISLLNIKLTIISEMISGGLILFLTLTYIFTLLNKVKIIYHLIFWLVFLSFYVQIIIAQISLCMNIKELSYLSINLLEQKVYLYIIVSHSSFCFLLKDQFKWRFINYIIAAIFDVGGMIGICFLKGEFLFETIFMFFIPVLIILIEIITLYHTGIRIDKSNKFINKNNSEVFLLNMCQELDFGYAKCLGNNFEILQSNEVLNNRYKRMIQLKQHYNKNNNIIGTNGSVNFISSKATAFYHLNSNNNPVLEKSPDILTRNSSSSKVKFDNKNQGPSQYFNTKDFHQKNLYDSLSGKYIERKDVKLSLEEVILKQIEICKSNKKFDTFINIGKFKYKKDGESLHTLLYIRISKNIEKKKYIFEFIFINVQPPQEKKKTKTNYENLLKKISHELRYPNMRIQKIVENILKESTTSKYSSISSMKDYQANLLMTATTLEQLKLIKYLSEVALLTIRDIIEYSTLNQKETRTIQEIDDEAKDCQMKASNLDMERFIRYINEITKSYFYLHNKCQELKLNIAEIIYTTQIIIDEQKLFQIISNLITNAIKNTSEHTPIVFSINTIHANDPLNSLRSYGSINNRLGNSLKMNDKKDNSHRTDKLIKDENDNFILGISIVIEDYGKGINSEIMNNINSKRNAKLKGTGDYSITKGFGAGLQICKKLCEEMNIELKCELIRKKGITSSKFISNGHSNQKQKTAFDKGQIIGTKFILNIESEVQSKKNLIDNDKERAQRDREISSRSTSKEIRNLMIEPSDKQILNYDEFNDDIEMTNITVNQSSVCKKKCLKKKSGRMVYSEEVTIDIDKKEKYLTVAPVTKQKKSSNKIIDKTIINDVKRLNPFNNSNSTNYITMHSPIITSKPLITSQYALDNPLNDDVCENGTIKVLIVDDDISVIDTVKRMIMTHCQKMNIPLKIVTLTDGFELLYEIYNEIKTKTTMTTKLIFCDEMMTYMNGSKAFRLIKRRLNSNIHEAFISISAFSDENHKQNIERSGIRYIYEKPIKRGHIEYIFEKFQRENERRE